MLRLLMLVATLAAPAAAAPVPYALEADRSIVGFTYFFGDDSDDGTMPVLDAELLIDLDEVARSQVDVRVDVTRARTGFFLATQALKGPSVLDAANHRAIRFRSTAVRRSGDVATIDGDFTIRGVTRPGTLTARFFRQRGTVAGDRDRLSILLTGAVSRAEFGATGYAGMVADRVELRILARIRRLQ